MTNHRRGPVDRRPWRAALIVALFLAAVALVAQPELPFVGADVPVAEVAGSAVDPTEGDSPEIVRSTEFAPTQQIVPAPPVFRRAPTTPRLPDVKCVPQSDVTLRVLTFNIHSGLGPRGLGLEQIAREIESWDADVVLMQEVDQFRAHSRGIDETVWLADRLGMNSAYGGNSSYGQRGQIGNGTLSRFPIVDQSNTYLPHQPSLPDTSRRGLLRTDIQVGETVVSIYNTHLQPAYDRLKLAQARVVGGAVAADPQPKILGGDFNAVSGSAVMSAVQPVLDDAWESVGAGPDGTSPNAHKARIDHLLYSSPFVPQTARTIESAVSDHRAVGAAFTLPGDPDVCVPVLDKGSSQGDS